MENLQNQKLPMLNVKTGQFCVFLLTEEMFGFFCGKYIPNSNAVCENYFLSIQFIVQTIVDIGTFPI